MEDEPKEEKIGSNYIIIEKICSGGTSVIYYVKDKEKDQYYIAKVPRIKTEEEFKIYYQREVDCLNELKNNPYIINIKDNGEDFIYRKKRNKKMKYIILEYAHNYDLNVYIKYTKNLLIEEKLLKLFFYKILKGFEEVHKLGYCHLDIKPGNILLDKDDNLKINDFGYSVKNGPELEEYRGTEYFAAPEIRENNPFDGIKADIYSLGVTLMEFTGQLSFNIIGYYEEYYSLLINEKKKKKDKIEEEMKNLRNEYENDFNLYWDDIKERIQFSDDFKDFYKCMNSYIPEERLDIEKLLNHKWLKEIRDLIEKNDESLVALENNIKNILRDKRSKVEKELINLFIKELSKNKSLRFFKRCGDEDQVFKEIPDYKFIEQNINTNYSILVKENEISYLNMVYYLFENIFGKKCFIEPVKEKFKFFAKFEEEEDDKEKEEEDDKEKEEEKEEKEKKNVNKVIKGNYVNVRVKLYKIKDGFLIKFSKKEGDKNKFIEIFKTICDSFKKIN